MKDQVGFHKLVYGESVQNVNCLIESLVNRGKENQFSKQYHNNKNQANNNNNQASNKNNQKGGAPGPPSYNFVNRKP